MMRTRLYCLMISFVLLCSCAASAQIPYTPADETKYEVSYVSEDGSEKAMELRAIWISQFDMKPVYRNGQKQREESDYRAKIEAMVQNLVRNKFNTVFLQVRPNGDSMAESKYYPMSKYIAGSYGGSIGYDAIAIFLEIAKSADISVHAWINPFRLCNEEEMKYGGKGKLYEWYSTDLGGRIKLGEDGILYLDPAYEEASELISDGARELLENYGFDGIHIDDYFYPTAFQLKDDEEFKASGMSDKSEFRKRNIDRTVRLLYETVHKFDGKRFGISPAGNFYSLPKKWYVDIEKWLSEDGYADYIIPQLYFGFENAVCPFEETLSVWAHAATNESTKLYIGLTAAKCANGSNGIADAFAGDTGRYEWRDSKDILSRELAVIRGNARIGGYCIFTYSSLFNPTSGEQNPLTAEEWAAFKAVI